MYPTLKIFFLTIFALIFNFAYSQPLDVLGLKLNPKLGLNPNSNNQPIKIDVVNSISFSANSFELKINVTPIKNSLGARQIQQISYHNIESLYAPRKNPYAGEVTAEKGCLPEYLPLVQSRKILGKNTKVIAGGASSRKALGACAQGDIKFLSCYFNFFDEKNAVVIEVRAYRPLAEPKPEKFKNEVRLFLNTCSEILTYE